MTAPVVRTLFNYLDSPQTGVGDANSAAVTAWDSESEDDGPISVYVNFDGTFNSVTLKFETTMPESPERWVKAQVLDPSAGTASDAAFTAAGSAYIVVPQGGKLRGVISGSGSPLPALTVKAYGQLV